MALKLEVNTVDGEKTISAFVDGIFQEEVDINSQFTVTEAKQYLRNKYKK